MPRSNILVVAVDGLRASALGAYGNTTYPTPALDRFATESLLFDNCYAPSADLADIYRALWQSLHPARTSSGSLHGPMPRLVKNLGYHSTLVTDQSQVVALADVADFHECVHLAPAAETVAPHTGADDVSHTELARTFAAVSELISRSPSQPQLVWAHARGMYGQWDAPLELQQSLLDDDGPSPIESVTPPDLELHAGHDSDDVFRYGCAYAAQVLVLDECWHRLAEAIEVAAGDGSWLVILIGARGYPLGEHRRIGGVDSRLYSEQLHVPWLIRFPDARGQLARSGALTSHLDVTPTLIEWICREGGSAPLNVDGSSAVPLATRTSGAWREALLANSSDGSYALRTSNWCLRTGQNGAAESDTAELYVRPDDRWEANDVAKLCPDVVEELQSVAVDMHRQLALNESLPRRAF
jgi:arylsulfatase A-like enzyme